MNRIAMPPSNTGQNSSIAGMRTRSQKKKGSTKSLPPRLLRIPSQLAMGTPGAGSLHTERATPPPRPPTLGSAAAACLVQSVGSVDSNWESQQKPTPRAKNSRDARSCESLSGKRRVRKEFRNNVSPRVMLPEPPFDKLSRTEVQTITRQEFLQALREHRSAIISEIIPVIKREMKNKIAEVVRTTVLSMERKIASEAAG